MSKLALAISSVIMLPTMAFATPSVGGCGLGSKLFAGQAGIAPQIFAVTTNGVSGNQTFGISTGTLGCSQDGIVQTNWKTAMFIDANTTKLARDMSVGQGETLESLASLLGVEEAKKGMFFKTSQENFGKIYPSADTSSIQVINSLRAVLLETPELAQYASAI